MATFRDWFAINGLEQNEYEIAVELGLASPSDVAYAFTTHGEASRHGLGAPWHVARQSATAYAYTRGVGLVQHVAHQQGQGSGNPVPGAAGCSPAEDRAAGCSRSQQTF